MRALAFLLALNLTPAIADDGAASIAAGGLVTKELHIGFYHLDTRFN